MSVKSRISVKVEFGPELIHGLSRDENRRHLAAISPDGFVTLYMLDVGEMMAEAENRLNRWWTEAECLQYLQSEVCPVAPDGMVG
jgi:hypothetical protein